MAENSTKKLTMMNILVKGSFIALIISVPTLIIFFVVWTISDDLLYGAIAGLITNFVTLGISFKIVNKKFTKKPKNDSEL